MSFQTCAGTAMPSLGLREARQRQSLESQVFTRFLALFCGLQCCLVAWLRAVGAWSQNGSLLTTASSKLEEKARREGGGSTSSVRGGAGSISQMLKRKMASVLALHLFAFFSTQSLTGENNTQAVLVPEKACDVKLGRRSQLLIWQRQEFWSATLHSSCTLKVSFSSDLPIQAFQLKVPLSSGKYI